jgi:hypothetical protein
MCSAGNGACSNARPLAYSREGNKLLSAEILRASQLSDNPTASGQKLPTRLPDRRLLGNLRSPGRGANPSRSFTPGF